MDAKAPSRLVLHLAFWALGPWLPNHGIGHAALADRSGAAGYAVIATIIAMTNVSVKDATANVRAKDTAINPVIKYKMKSCYLK